MTDATIHYNFNIKKIITMAVMKSKSLLQTSVSNYIKFDMLLNTKMYKIRLYNSLYNTTCGALYMVKNPIL